MTDQTTSQITPSVNQTTSVNQTSQMTPSLKQTTSQMTPSVNQTTSQMTPSLKLEKPNKLTSNNPPTCVRDTREVPLHHTLLQSV